MCHLDVFSLFIDCLEQIQVTFNMSRPKLPAASGIVGQSDNPTKRMVSCRGTNVHWDPNSALRHSDRFINWAINSNKLIQEFGVAQTIRECQNPVNIRTAQPQRRSGYVRKPQKFAFRPWLGKGQMRGLGLHGRMDLRILMFAHWHPKDTQFTISFDRYF
jgi:hypothetical protein